MVKVVCVVNENVYDEKLRRQKLIFLAFDCSYSQKREQVGNSTSVEKVLCSSQYIFANRYLRENDLI